MFNVCSWSPIMVKNLLKGEIYDWKFIRNTGENRIQSSTSPDIHPSADGYDNRHGYFFTSWVNPAGETLQHNSILLFNTGLPGCFPSHFCRNTWLAATHGRRVEYVYHHQDDTGHTPHNSPCIFNQGKKKRKHARKNFPALHTLPGLCGRPWIFRRRACFRLTLPFLPWFFWPRPEDVVFE